MSTRKRPAARPSRSEIKPQRPAEKQRREPVADTARSRYRLVIECADEAEQRALYEAQTAAGRGCKVLTF